MKRTLLAVLVAMFVGTSSAADAQSNSDEWEFQIAPLYLWAMGIDGSMTLRGPIEQDFHVDFSDAFDNLDAAFTVHFEAHKGRWGILADVSSLSLAGEQEIDTPGGLASIDIENLVFEVGGMYEFTDRWWFVLG